MIAMCSLWLPMILLCLYYLLCLTLTELVLLNKIISQLYWAVGIDKWEYIAVKVGSSSDECFLVLTSLRGCKFFKINTPYCFSPHYLGLIHHLEKEMMSCHCYLVDLHDRLDKNLMVSSSS